MLDYDTLPPLALAEADAICQLVLASFIVATACKQQQQQEREREQEEADVC